MSYTVYNGISEELDTSYDIEIEEPSMFKVIMHNDHYTTMQFVIEVLRSVFHKNEDEATKIMLEIHNKGAAVCGIYIFDIANTKVNHVHNLARRAGHPLKCTLEEE